MLKLGLFKDYTDNEVAQWIVREFAPRAEYGSDQCESTPVDIASVEERNATYEVLIARNDDLFYEGRCWLVLR